MKIIKRDGREVPFDRTKIEAALAASSADVPEDALSREELEQMAARVENRCAAMERAVGVEEIQDMVISELADSGHVRLALHYSDYRLRHEMLRKQNSTDKKILALLRHDSEVARQENANKDPVINSTMRDYLASEVSEDICRRYIFPEDVIRAHDEGIIHIHDMGYVSGPISNCELVNLEDMLQNGTVITETLIEKPHSFSTACNIATQIIAQVASNTYGGQTISLAHLAPFVDVSRQKYKREVREELDAVGKEYTEAEVGRMAEMRVRKEVERGIQTIQYQIQTLLTTNGQTPFVSIFMYLDEVPAGQTRDDLALIIGETLRQRHQGIKNEVGVWVSPAFPKLIYVLDDDNMTEDAPYWYLTVMAAECTAKRMVPDYISAKIMKQLKGDVYTCMGCRAFLTPDTTGMNPDGSHKYYGRFNQGAVTINLVDVACSAEGNKDKFWQLMEERTELCHKALRIRHETLLGTPSDVAPILWQHGAIARLKKGEKQAPRDFLTKKPDKSAKYESRYLVDDHEAVIIREVWNAVQLRLGQHQEEVMNGGYYDGRAHFLHGRIFCGDCGAMMTRRTVRCSSRPDNKETRKVWTCKERHKGRKGNGCLMRNITEEELLAAICFQMGLPNAENFPVGRFRQEIEKVEVMDNGIWVIPRQEVKSA